MTCKKFSSLVLIGLVCGCACTPAVKPPEAPAPQQQAPKFVCTLVEKGPDMKPLKQPELRIGEGFTKEDCLAEVKRRVDETQANAKMAAQLAATAKRAKVIEAPKPAAPVEVKK